VSKHVLANDPLWPSLQLGSLGPNIYFDSRNLGTNLDP